MATAKSQNAKTKLCKKEQKRAIKSDYQTHLLVNFKAFILEELE